jgi:hypothetical protein
MFRNERGMTFRVILGFVFVIFIKRTGKREERRRAAVLVEFESSALVDWLPVILCLKPEVFRLIAWYERGAGVLFG